jgi:hypothetical protein
MGDIVAESLFYAFHPYCNENFPHLVSEAIYARNGGA